MNKTETIIGAAAPRHHSGLAVVELVGPAGAGKTSLALALGERNPSWRIRPRPGPVAHLRSAITLVPTYAGLHSAARRSAWKEMKRVTYLESLGRMATGSSGRTGSALVFDEGPIYMLARLRQYGAGVADHPAMAGWWRRALQRWAAALDLVVWLDAPDAVLAERVRTRAKQHRIKAVPDADAGAFFASYRTIYRQLLVELGEYRPLPILECRTEGAGLAELVRRVDRAVRGLTERS